MCACFGVDCTASAASTAAHVASLCCCREQLPDPDAPGPHHEIGDMPAAPRGCVALVHGWQLLGWWFNLRPRQRPALGDEVYLQILARYFLIQWM